LVGLALLVPELILFMSSFDHNLYDAALAAYTARLYSDGEVEVTGDPGEGVIYIPKSPVA
jgi:predicted nuclease with RNAse H fold